MNPHNARIYGVPKGRKKFVELSELGFLGKEKDMRAIAAFLILAADGLKKSKTFGHLHFKDAIKKPHISAPDIIVTQADYGKAE